jgi:reversibly glycosylated polypeptide/UDP-arabinopyranose mutase
MRVFVVIPTVRNLSFLAFWGRAFTTCSLIVVEDHQRKGIPTPTKGFRRVYHYSWEDIKRDFGKDEWIFPRQNAGIRSYGFWKAYTLGADIIITLDDDCYPDDEDFVSQHLSNLAQKAPTGWFPTFPHPEFMYTRGFPYRVRRKHRVVISHGLWSHAMDMDARTQIAIGNVNIRRYPPIRQFIPFGYYFPMSSMNLAFVRDITPLMYFPLMGKNPAGRAWGFDRYDDIWAGIFAKKILDHLGLAVASGSPFVEHKKASDPAVNAKKEQKGMRVNEDLWKFIDAVRLTGKTPAACYKELSVVITKLRPRYFADLAKAMGVWIRLFDTRI